MTAQSPRIVFVWFLSGLIVLSILFSSKQTLAQTYDFDEGITALTEGLLGIKQWALKDRKIAVFGIIESKSGKRWEISSHIEDGIVDVLVNRGFTVIERRRINDVIQKELKKSADFWFDQAQVTQVGKLLGADVVVTGRYVQWGGGTLRISIRAVNVSDGKVMAANKVKILTDRIAELLKPVKEDQGAKKPVPQKPAQKNDTPPQTQPSPQVKQPVQNPPVYTPPATTQVPAAPQMGSFCCDQFGNRRCTLVQPVPLGSPCFCPGQGYGYTCP